MAIRTVLAIVAAPGERVTRPPGTAPKLLLRSGHHADDPACDGCSACESRGASSRTSGPPYGSGEGY